MEKQTAVDFLYNSLDAYDAFRFESEYNRAKEIEKKQIIECGFSHLENSERFCGDKDAAIEEATEYYNKKFGV